MPARYRTDVTTEDFFLVSRVKAYLDRAIREGTITDLVEVPYNYRQRWTQVKGEWAKADRVPDTEPAVAVRLTDFRKFVKGIQREVMVTEGRIIHALEKMSMLRYTGLDRGWKTKDNRILLEKGRFFERTIRKRKETTPAARLERAEKERQEALFEAIRAGMPPDVAENFANAHFSYIPDLEEAVALELSRKPRRYAEVKARIEQKH